MVTSRCCASRSWTPPSPTTSPNREMANPQVLGAHSSLRGAGLGYVRRRRLRPHRLRALWGFRLLTASEGCEFPLRSEHNRECVGCIVSGSPRILGAMPALSGDARTTCEFHPHFFCTVACASCES